MAPDKEHRIGSAIESLVAELVPPDLQGKSSQTRQRQNTTVDSVKRLLESQAGPVASSDINVASDLIRKKLVQSKPHQALRYGSLYNKLLSLPVLGQKWAILYFLYQLSDSSMTKEPQGPLSSRLSRQAELGPVGRPVGEHLGTEPGSPAESYSIEQQCFPIHTGSEFSTSPRHTDNRRAMSGSELDGSNTKASVMKVDSPHNLVTLRSPIETNLLRDLPFTLQGLGSTTLKFSSRDGLKIPPTLPAPIVALLHSTAEPSLLYSRLETFVKTPPTEKALPKSTLQQSHGLGLLNQSLRAAIAAELRSYLTLIATLEGQIRRALSSTADVRPWNAYERTGVTLKRCAVWIQEATMGLRLLDLIAEESGKGRRGGQLITLIHEFSSSHGDPMVAAFAERLLAEVTRPFYDILRHWIYDGELLDPYKEFFVNEKNNRGDRTNQRENTPASVWIDKYEIDVELIPSIVTQDFAHKVFLIGKSLNFIRHSCGDSDWVENYSKAASKELRYGDTATLEAWIDEAYKITMKRLVDLMTHKFHLLDHLKALKDYILLGQGDFIALLMESLAANLERPAEAQYRHTLTAQLEHAIRGSNAQYDSPEVLRRLDARMLQLSHGDIGWDCFTLEYKVDAPVDVVVTDWGNRQYLKVFNFLWRVKRVEFALSMTWRKCMTGSRGILQSPNTTVVQTWKSTRGILAEMIHFVGQLQYYILFEVIESSWGELQRRIRKDDCTLDDIIKAHEQYLDDITHKGLLGAKQRFQHTTDSTTADDNRTWHLKQLSELLRIMLSYRDSVDGLYSWSVSDFTLRQEADVRHLSHQGQVKSCETTPNESLCSEFPPLQDRLKQLGSNFRNRLQILLGDLAYQSDIDMRFLGVTMNFNDVYQPTRRKSRAVVTPNSGGTRSIKD